jgi:hypothetical protein
MIRSIKHANRRYEILTERQRVRLSTYCQKTVQLENLDNFVYYMQRSDLKGYFPSMF